MKLIYLHENQTFKIAGWTQKMCLPCNFCSIALQKNIQIQSFRKSFAKSYLKQNLNYLSMAHNLNHEKSK